MRLDRFLLENFGPIRKVELTLDPGFNVLAGVNGAGKTSILTALALMLSRYSSAVRTGRAVGTFSRDQVHRGARATQATVDASDGKDKFGWSAGIARPGPVVLTRLTRSRQLITYATNRASAIESDPNSTSLPIVAFYSVNRAVLDIPLRIRSKVPYEQYGALEDSLSTGARNFRTFFAWFREREDVENETRAVKTRWRDPQLKAVRRAISCMLPGFNDLRVKRQPLRMLISKEDVDVRVDQLSDGEKCMLALAGDLARRLAMANPGLSNPLRGSAVVLIDELELHLHPAWQRTAVVQLQETFPHTQFIVTTHSAQVLSEVAPKATFLLRDGEVVQPRRSQGRDSNLILQELMGVAERPEWAAKEIEELYDFLDDENYSRAEKLFLRLEERLGVEDPSLTAARSLLNTGDRK